MTLPAACLEERQRPHPASPKHAMTPPPPVGEEARPCTRRQQLRRGRGSGLGAPIPTAHCPLPTAHCPTAHCPLPTAHCPLPTPRSPAPAPKWRLRLLRRDKSWAVSPPTFCLPSTRTPHLVGRPPPPSNTHTRPRSHPAPAPTPHLERSVDIVSADAFSLICSSATISSAWRFSTSKGPIRATAASPTSTRRWSCSCSGESLVKPRRSTDEEG